MMSPGASYAWVTRIYGVNISLNIGVCRTDTGCRSHVTK